MVDLKSYEIRQEYAKTFIENGYSVEILPTSSSTDVHLRTRKLVDYGDIDKANIEAKMLIDIFSGERKYPTGNNRLRGLKIWKYLEFEKRPNSLLRLEGATTISMLGLSPTNCFEFQEGISIPVLKEFDSHVMERQTLLNLVFSSDSQQIKFNGLQNHPEAEVIYKELLQLTEKLKVL